MGLIRGALKTTTRATRTTYRAGRSVARGKVPSVSVGLRVPGGVGLRVGTKGVSLRTPIARQSLGTSGFRTTVGVPGLAHVTLNPTRPSVTGGLGPLSATLARDPGLSLNSRFVAVGVTTRPLLWLRVGTHQFKLPGQLAPAAGKRWYEEIDDQWQPYYQRRPPAVSEQLHDIIDEVESEATSAAFTLCSVRRPSSVQWTSLDDSVIKAHLKGAKKDARRESSVFARKKRRAALAAAARFHAAWEAAEEARIDAEGERLTALVEGAYEAWASGNPTAGLLVANALLAATGGSGALTSIVDNYATLVVFGTPLDEVHPSKPTWSANGSKTIKSRTKAERSRAHLQLAGAVTVAALHAVEAALPGVSEVHVFVIAASSSSGDLGDAPTIASFQQHRGSLPESPDELHAFMTMRALAKAQPLRTLLPDAFRGSDDVPAVASLIESVDDLRQPDFWLEISAALAELAPDASAPPWVPPALPEPMTRQQAAAEIASEATAERMNRFIAELNHVQDRATALARQSLINDALKLVTKLQSDDVPQHLIEYLVTVLNYCASRLDDEALVAALSVEAERLCLSAHVQVSLASLARSMQVAEQESRLRALLEVAKGAVDAADASAVTEVFKTLLAALPEVPDGADDEAEDVARAVLYSVIALRLDDLVTQLGAALPRCGAGVQQRFRPIEEELRSMTRVAMVVMAHVVQEPGSLQSSLGSVLGLEQSEVRHVTWYLDHYGLLARTKKGSSYLLYPIDDE